MKALNSQKGISLYLTLIVMALLLAMVLGLSAILVRQIEMMRRIGDSVIALSAADSGIERALYDGLSPRPYYSGYLNGSSYKVKVTQPLGGNIRGIPRDPNCPASLLCIRSVGKFRDVKRAIEVFQ